MKKTEKPWEPDANTVIDRLGGTNETARICEITPPSVSEWRERGEIPKARLQYLRLLRPDVFKRKGPELSKRRKAA